MNSVGLSPFCALTTTSSQPEALTCLPEVDFLWVQCEPLSKEILDKSQEITRIRRLNQTRSELILCLRDETGIHYQCVGTDNMDEVNREHTQINLGRSGANCYRVVEMI